MPVLLLFKYVLVNTTAFFFDADHQNKTSLPATVQKPDMVIGVPVSSCLERIVTKKLKIKEDIFNLSKNV